jgi:translocation and assembly module TamB
MRAFRLLAIGVGGVVGLIAFLFLALQFPAVQRMAASVLSKAVSGQHGGVDFDGPSGLFPTSMSFERISYRDGQGPWLMADNVHLRWSLASLLGGLLEVEELTAERVALLRLPQASQDTEAKDDSRTALPVGVEIKQLSINELHVSEAVAGVDSNWKVTGNMRLPADLARGKAMLEARRIDGPQGRLTVDGSTQANRASTAKSSIRKDRPASSQRCCGGLTSATCRCVSPCTATQMRVLQI